VTADRTEQVVAAEDWPAWRQGGLARKASLTGRKPAAILLGGLGESRFSSRETLALWLRA